MSRGISPGAGGSEGDAMRTDMTSARLAFGATRQQLDEIDRLLRIISAHGDVVWSGNASALNADSLPVLGESIYEAAEALGNVLDTISAQTLKAADATPTPIASQEDRPTFDSDMHEALLQAYSVAELISVAAHQGGGMDDASGACRLVPAMLWKVQEYIADHFDSLPKTVRDG